MVAGGTGFAPIKSVVEHAIAEGCTRPITIYWGGRSRADLYQLDVAEGWTARRADIHFVPVLSEPAATDAWSGRTGLVHEAVIADFPDLSAHQVYVCGSPAMVAAARRDFHERCKLPQNEFFADSFEFANDRANDPD
jgi:CDP-4-dehydro-6-deoxyglucose reductase